VIEGKTIWSGNVGPVVAAKNVDKAYIVIYSSELISYRPKGEPMAEINRPNGLSADMGAYLGPGTKINGKLQFDGQATIDGEVEGEIIAQAHVTVGQQATVKGKISAASILVQGKVMADVQADKKLEVQPPGSVIGDVTTQSLVIGDGAILEGHVSMKKTEGRVLPIRQDIKKETAL
jgi:cytoskeletal protein CcmA (bactofilin family)